MIQKELRSSLTVIGILVAIFITQHSFAQDVEISDEELKVYALGMNKIDSIKKDMSRQYNDMIKNEPAIKGGRRFNELKKANGDEAKLKEIEASPEEIAAYAKIQETYALMKGNLKETSTEIIKADIGASIYNKVRKALKADGDIKSRYDEVSKSLKPDEEDV